MDAIELSVHRLNTKHFINADPITVILHRNIKTRNDAGGYVWNRGETGHGVPLLEPQTFRILPASENGTPDEVRSSNGRTLKPRGRLLGMHDADIQRWDQFQFKGIWYEVVTPPEPLHSSESVYEKKALLVVFEDN